MMYTQVSTGTHLLVNSGHFHCECAVSILSTIDPNLLAIMVSIILK